MVIWLLFAVLTALIVFVVLGPLSGRTQAADRAAEGANIAVYQDQLAEIDADLERGVIGAEEAQSARVEVARKILQVTEAAKANTHSEDAPAGPDGEPIPTGTPSAPRKTLALVLTGLIPLAAGLTYAGVGSPHLPDLPHAPRLKENIKTATAANLLARVEARLRTHPEDGRGWDVIAPFYFRAGRYSESADAYRNAIRLLGETPQRMLGYVKAAVGANNGIVTEELRKISQRLTELVPNEPQPKFWLALALEQDGNLVSAKKAYSDLLALATDKDPWRKMVQARLDKLEEQSPK